MFVVIASTSASFASAADGATFDVVARSQLTVEAARLGAELSVSGQVRDDLGRGVPYRQVEIRLSSGGSPALVSEVTTDRSGRFEARRLVADGPWTVQANFRGDLFIEPSEASAEAEIELASVATEEEVDEADEEADEGDEEPVVRSPAELAFNAIVIAGVVALLVAFAATVRRELRTAKPVAARSLVEATTAAGGTPTPSENTVEAPIYGVVVDAESGVGLPATLRWRPRGAVGSAENETLCDSSGRFTIEHDSAVEVDVGCPGYLATTTELRPNAKRGGVAVRLRSVRAEVREILRALVDEVWPDPSTSAWWGRRSPAELGDLIVNRMRPLRHRREPHAVAIRELADRLDAAAKAGRADVAPVEALILLVDRVYFGASSGTERTIEIARDLAEQARGLR